MIKYVKRANQYVIMDFLFLTRDKFGRLIKRSRLNSKWTHYV